MAFTPEDGTGITGANSYITEAYFDAYFTDRGNTEATDLTMALKESYSILATDYIETVYYGAFIGTSLTTTQGLQFPRIDDNEDEIDMDRLRQATCELAFKANSGDLLIDVEQRVIKKKIGPMEKEYDKYSDQKTQYTRVYNLLLPYLENTSSYSMKLERT